MQSTAPMLHLVSVPVNYQRLRRWSRHVGLFKSRWHIDDAIAAGHALRQFGACDVGVAEPRYSVSPGGTIAFYLPTLEAVDALNRTSGLAELASAGLDIPGLSTRSVLIPQREQEIEFKARIRPVASRPVLPGAVLQDERLIDLYILADVASPSGVDRTAIYRAWLADELKSAGTLEGFFIDRLSQRTIWTLIAGGAMRPDRGPDVHVSGSLRIEEPEVFRDKLLQGIGEFAQHGMGMISALSSEPYEPGGLRTWRRRQG